jgi:hypothetical protein
VRAQGIKDVAFDGVVEKVGLLGRDAMGAVLFAVDVRVTGSRVAEAEKTGSAAPPPPPPPTTTTTKTTSSSSDAGVASVIVEAPAPAPSVPLPTPRELLRPGMTASAEIEVEHLDKAIVVPLAAVLEATKGDDDEKPDRVFVIDESAVDAGTGSPSTSQSAKEADRIVSVREVAVRLGPSEADAIAVLDAVAAGLRPGVRVVEGPFRELKDLEEGARVRELVDDDKDTAGRGDSSRKALKKSARKKRAP